MHQDYLFSKLSSFSDHVHTRISLFSWHNWDDEIMAIISCDLWLHWSVIILLLQLHVVNLAWTIHQSLMGTVITRGRIGIDFLKIWSWISCKISCTGAVGSMNKEWLPDMHQFPSLLLLLNIHVLHWWRWHVFLMRGHKNGFFVYSKHIQEESMRTEIEGFAMIEVFYQLQY